VIKNRTLWIFLLSTLAIGISNAREPADARYTIEANVNPAEETLVMNVVAQVFGPAETSEFLLHSDLTIESIEGDRIGSSEVVELEQLMGLSPAHVSSVTLTFDPPLAKGESADIAWRYAGWIKTGRIQLGPGSSSVD